MAGGMATTHLSRTGKDALSLKARRIPQLLTYLSYKCLDLEAAVLSCYGYHSQARVRPRSTSQMQSRLKHLLSRGKDQYAQRDLLHGYMFDAWSGRKCGDQFLELNVKWPLNTDEYLKLLTGLNLGDHLLSTLLTITRQESTRLVGLILESPVVTAELFGGLFIWTVDQIDVRYRKKQCSPHPQEASNNPGEFIRMWTDRAKERESIRRLFRVSFKKILHQLVMRQNRRQRGGISYWGLGDKDRIDVVQLGFADEIIQGLLADVIAILVEHPIQGDDSQFGQEIYEDLKRWDQLFTGGSGFKLSKLLSPVVRPPKRKKHEKQQGHITGSEHIEWVESTIRNRSAGWLSCAKLKLQFFAVFGESYINEELADIICDHDLHWELCSTLLRYLRRHRADPIRMPADTMICKDARGPLFGSWEFWRINIDTLLTSTLNQVVVSEDSPQSSAVSPQTIEALVKISLIAPYRVLSRIVHSIIVNRGQCALLLQVILGLGQLAWLRSSPKEPTLLISVLQLLLHTSTADSDDPGLIWDEQQQENFVDFVVKAMAKRSSTTGMSLLNPTAFLTDCVAPFMDDMESGHPSPLFQSVTRILLAIYERKPVQASAAAMESSMESEGLLPREIQLRILLRLLQLRTQENPWTAERHDSRRKTTVQRGGGEHLVSLSRLCETIVLRMNAYVSSLAENDLKEQRLFLEFGQAVQGEGCELVDLESRLVTVPFMDACQRNLGLDMGLPSLPSELFGLCGDRLRMFEYSGPMSHHMDILTMDKAAKAVVLFLDLGRMCDDVLADMTQAIDFGGDLPPSTQHMLRSTMTPALYRVLSISTRHQSHRLLTHAVPVMAQLWGGPSDSSLYWDDLDNPTKDSHSQCPMLGSYWDSFMRGGRQQEEEDSEMSEPSTLLKNIGDSLDILLTLEAVLWFSLVPLPSKGLEAVLQVYESDLGYDMMPDQVASLVQSTFKAIQIEWTKVPLDHLLYCFMKVCKMSSVVDTQHQTNTFSNRLSPRSELELPSSAGRPTDEIASCWRSAYLKFMSQPMDDATKRRLDIAQAKARDELVLMAMNLSEALVSRQDSFYGKLSELSVVQNDDDTNGDGYSRGRGRGKRGRGRGGRGQKGAEGLELAGGPNPHGHKRQEARQAANRPLDKGTQAWFNGIMTTLATQDSSSTVQDEGDSINSRAPDSMAIESAAASSLNLDPTSTVRDEGEVSMEMLNADQVDCLLLALAYLPAQESQAVRSRLHHLLNLQPAKALKCP
ncbi:hypothetical protein BG015_001802 [Linnemannia schmuckeri]|uniref:Uncharacterized protein n=1 Tax=Linnemannia schmuckeri TaxID=64567 RepID=A0A9P5RS14_9FUNG|nr:hypothetical protein BG015_001802 [Linnemannia schmuckeri]